MTVCRLPASGRLTSYALRCTAVTAVVLLGPLSLPAVHAQGTEQQLEPVVVTGTSGRERRIIEAPYAITAVDAAELRSSGPMINLSEALGRVPGLTAANRNNYAQDLQISSRGFGARSTFGVRGLRLYADGIPATMPDGQGQVAHFDLAGADRVEVLRGPFSVLYGNSSGGVIAVFSKPVRERRLEGAIDVGDFGMRQVRVGIETPLAAGFDLSARWSGFDIDGFRPHSEADRKLTSARLGWARGDDRVTLTLSDQRQNADDPLGLSRAQYDADPYQTTPQANQFDTRKTIDQTQVGVNWRHFFGEGVLRDSSLSAYTGSRSVTQYLAIPPATQLNPKHGGGVIDFARRYGGVDGRLTFGWDTLEVAIGAAAETQRDDRRGYENFIGIGPDQVLGVQGALRRDETNHADTRDVFAQAEWQLATSLVGIAGVRSGHVKLSTDDAYLSNGDDSGSLRFSYTNPVLGLRWIARPDLTVHASVAHGFESPTLGELAYRPDGSGGFNENLKPQTSRQAEIGAKWRAGAVDLDTAVFVINTDDEIGVATNAGGRASYQNVGRTQRYGLEIGGRWRPDPAVRVQWALTWLHAKYRDDFLTCAGIPCTAPSVPVPAGNDIAGTQPRSGWAELAWRPGFVPGEFAVEWQAAGSTVVNDTNSDRAAGYGIFNLRWLHAVPLPDSLRLEVLARIDNVANRTYVGSVIVNDANGRYFETGAPLAGLISLRVIRTW
jgi:iron complex outermembrane receptor protein